MLVQQQSTQSITNVMDQLNEEEKEILKKQTAKKGNRDYLNTQKTYKKAKRGPDGYRIKEDPDKVLSDSLSDAESVKSEVIEQVDQKFEIEHAQKRGPLTIGKQQKVLETSLDFAEKKILKEAIKVACAGYKAKVAEKYTDDFKASIMISEEDTQIKNEILRKIKYHYMKKNNLPDLKRNKREEILKEREEKEKL